MKKKTFKILMLYLCLILMIYSYFKSSMCFESELYSVQIGFLAKYDFLYRQEHRYLYGTKFSHSIVDVDCVLFICDGSIELVSLVQSLIRSCVEISLFHAIESWPRWFVPIAKCIIISLWSGRLDCLFVQNLRRKCMTTANSITAKIPKRYNGSCGLLSHSLILSSTISVKFML